MSILSNLSCIYDISTDEAQRFQSEAAHFLDLDRFFCDPFLDDSGQKGPVVAVIPAGQFWLGSPDWEKGRAANEGPQRKVSIERPFAIARFLVSVAEFKRAFVWKHALPKGLTTESCPCFGISKFMAQSYAHWLSEKTGQCYRLPSEAEWEYAARAGTATRFVFGDEVVSSQVSCAPTGTLMEIRTLAENSWGLYGMHGNLWEWVEDDWQPNYNGHSGTAIPWTSDGQRGVLRGGCWNAVADKARSASRSYTSPHNEGERYGFRLVRELTVNDR